MTMYRNERGDELTPERFDPFALVVLGTTFVWRVARAATVTLAALDDHARAHGNHRRRRRAFADGVRDTIERL